MTQRSAAASPGVGAANPGASDPKPAPGDLASSITGTVAIVGPGRLGTVIAEALRRSAIAFSGPYGRGYAGASADEVVLLCVHDAAIARAAACISKGPLVAHCSGATGLAAIAPHRGFSMHPLMTFTRATSPDVLSNIPAAVAGTDDAALAVARGLAWSLQMRPLTIAESDRAAYHAAACIASNFLITLQAAAATLISTAGVDPMVLLPIARAALENWGEQGAAALTGPVARGDQAVVDAHRQAIDLRAPELLTMFDALVEATKQLNLQPHSGARAAPEHPAAGGLAR